MQEIEFLRSRIPAYADYGDEDARHLVDKQVRAYVGEALSVIRERLGSTLAGPLAERLEAVLLMCEFTNQDFVHRIDHAQLSEDDLEHLHVVDHALIAAADRSEPVDVTTLGEFLEEVSGLFGRRAKAVVVPVA